MKSVASYNVSSVVLICSIYKAPWPYCDIRSCCHQSVHAFTSRYDSTLLGCTFVFTDVVFAWDIIIFVRFMHCYRSRIFDSHIASYPGGSWSVSALSSIDYTTCTELLIYSKNALQFYDITLASLVNNSKPKVWHFQQGLILLGLFLSIVHTIIIHYH